MEVELAVWAWGPPVRGVVPSEAVYQVLGPGSRARLHFASQQDLD